MMTALKRKEEREDQANLAILEEKQRGVEEMKERNKRQREKEEEAAEKLRENKAEMMGRREIDQAEE